MHMRLKIIAAALAIVGIASDPAASRPDPWIVLPGTVLDCALSQHLRADEPVRCEVESDVLDARGIVVQIPSGYAMEGRVVPGFSRGASVPPRAAGPNSIAPGDNGRLEWTAIGPKATRLRPLVLGTQDETAPALVSRVALSPLLCPDETGVSRVPAFLCRGARLRIVAVQTIDLFKILGNAGW